LHFKRFSCKFDVKVATLLFKLQAENKHLVAKGVEVEKTIKKVKSPAV
jgi:hypothetical protein